MYIYNQFLYLLLFSHLLFLQLLFSLCWRELLPTKTGKQWVNSPRLRICEKGLSLLLTLSNYLTTNMFYSPFKKQQQQQTSHLAVFAPWFSGLLALMRGQHIICIPRQVESLLPRLAWSFAFSLICGCAKSGWVVYVNPDTQCVPHFQCGNWLLVKGNSVS